MSINIRLDVDPVIICPYDKNHRIARSRIQRHLVKCEKNFPPDYKQQCPYDATHRVFEHEMIEHVETCPMKIANPVTIGGNHIGNLTEIESNLESEIESDEIWSVDAKTKSNDEISNKNTFEAINIKQYTNFTSIRGNALIANHCDSSLRRPFGYPESYLLDLSNQSVEEDTQSETDNMGIGRGQGFFRNLSGNYIRGINRTYKRGFHGRLLN